MKLLLSLLSVCVSFVLSAQSPDEKEVIAAVETLRQAMVDGNKSMLEGIAADELSYGHSSGVVEDKDTFVENIASGKSDFVSIDISDQTITLAGTNAIVRHKLSGTTNNNGTAGALNLSVLLVWQKQKGKWKLLARQAVRQQS